jgi:hypothetical protein
MIPMLTRQARSGEKYYDTHMSKESQCGLATFNTATSANSPHTTACLKEKNVTLMASSGQAPIGRIPTAMLDAETEIVIGGMSLVFPFPPYPSQVCMANQMIRAFKLRKHALLESPTGTGAYSHSICVSAVLYSLVISRQITGYSVLEHCMAAV